MRAPRIGLLAALLLAAPLAAQDGPSGIAAPCLRTDVPDAARDACRTAAQALVSTQPQLGILLSGGNPTLGSASTAGLRVPGSPGGGAMVKVNFVPVRIPDVLVGEAVGAPLEEKLIAAPAISGTLALNVARGTDLSPTVGGIGAVDLLGSLTWLPLRSLGLSSFRLESNEFSYGIGARVGLLRESFTLPGASVSFMYRRFSEVGYGSVCRLSVPASGGGSEGYRFGAGTCAGDGDAGEFALDLTGLSGRGVIGKQLGRLGLAGGVGFDRFDSDVGYGFRAPLETAPGTEGYVARAADLDLVAHRWSAFGNATFTTVVTTFALEAGWMQGGDAVPGFQGGDFDPGRGTLFGSLGVRLSF